MIYSLKGSFIHSEPGFVVIECAGVGYKCLTTVNTQRSLRLNTEVTVFTYLNVREDAVDLFGFSDPAELEFFKTLISVNGVGPKAALAVLSVLSPQQLAIAVASSDVKAITRANGVGAKIAQRIVLELKDKVTSISGVADGATAEGGGLASLTNANVAKAVEALTVLGYSPSDVAPTLSQLDSSLPIETLISETLKKMGRK